MRECHIRACKLLLSGMMKISQSCGWWIPYENVAFVSERHSVLNRDEQGRLHSETCPALSYPGDWNIYAIHGVRVPEYIILRPEEITIGKIDGEENTEIRRVMIERYGMDRYLLDGNAKEISHDKYGILWRKEIPDDEPLVMVQVKNSTPEQDGRFKDYFLRVPPTMKTAKQAVAWTFEEEANEYAPLVES